MDAQQLYKSYNEWFKKNWLVMLGIVIIVAFVLYDVATIQVQKAKVINQCNDHWLEMVKKNCPILFERQEPFIIDGNISIS